MSGDEAVAAALPDNVRSPFPVSDPNQLIVELIQNAKHIKSLVIIARDENGRLYTSWSDQDVAELAEATMLLTSTVSENLMQDHGEPYAEDEHPELKFSFVANAYEEELEAFEEDPR